MVTHRHRSRLLPPGVAVISMAALVALTRLFPFWGWVALLGVTMLSGIVVSSSLGDRRPETLMPQQLDDAPFTNDGHRMPSRDLMRKLRPQWSRSIEYLAWLAVLGAGYAVAVGVVG